MQYFYRLFALWQTALLIIPSTLCHAAPPRQGYYYEDQQAIAIREMRDNLESVKLSVSNQETEVRSFEQKLENLDAIIESVRDQISNTSQSHKDQLKGSTTTLESKLTSLETNIKGILGDIKQFQNYSTESTATLAQYKKKITELEKTIEIQNQNIDDMQIAMKSLMEMFQIKSGITTKAPTKPASTVALSAPPAAITTSSDTTTTSTGSEILYKVKEGDSLEKIARAHQTTIKAIKELNGLTSDKIVVGKTLKIPAPT